MVALAKFFVYLLLVLPSFVYAWGNRGHKIIVEIAKSHLDRKVIEAVDHYLMGLTWEQAACWMDEIHDIKQYRFMDNWHYVNIEKDKTYVKTKEEDVVQKIEFCIRMLQYKTLQPLETMNETLKVLFHLVADIHQPLHCGYASDKGANLVKVKYQDKETTLHKIWDSEIIENKKIDIWTCTKALVGMNLSAKRKIEVEKTDIVYWAYESRGFLQDAYNFKDGKIDQRYIDNNAVIVERQLAIAGLRLAAILRQIFKS